MNKTVEQTWYDANSERQLVNHMRNNQDGSGFLRQESEGNAMMIAMTLTALFTVVAIATGLSLFDSWLRGRADFQALLREKGLLDAGFVPQVEASDVRLRLQPRRTLAAATRPYARRVPVTVLQQAG